MLFFILLVIGIACIFIYNYIYKHTYHDTIIPFAIGAVAFGLALIFGLCWLCNQIGAPAKYNSITSERESIVYQLENNFYENDNEVGRAEFMRQITEWNSELAYNKIMCKNIWVGFLYYDFWPNIEPIPLE